MFAGASPLQQTVAHNGLSGRRSTEALRLRAAQAFGKAQLKGVLFRLFSSVLGRSTNLLDLSAVEEDSQPGRRHFTGLKLVSINEIVGSAGRESDFDAGFHPLQEHNRERWISVAIARQRGIPLPPVELVMIDSGYYVVDGHHRISVAKHMGQHEIEAEVTVWETS